jgi:hypothetical protein
MKKQICPVHKQNLINCLANEKRALDNHLSYSLEKQAQHKETIEALKAHIAELELILSEVA